MAYAGCDPTISFRSQPLDFMKKFVIGDIHSHYNKMMELFEIINFDFENDTLISLGDLIDRGPNPIEVIETLMKVNNFIHILGNHDEWCYKYLLEKGIVINQSPLEVPYNCLNKHNIKE